ncbi:hypothetical protein TNCV_3134911 [Trichonephila clavipes]|nr:hypothetical protein TNCV_3134911 [Trichonephila clavipes]
MIWGTFYWHGSVELVFIKAKQTTMRHLDTLTDQIHPQCCIFTLTMRDTSWTIMQLYIVPEVFKNWFAEHQSDFQHLPCPPHRPYLRPIENMWDMAERRIRQHSPLPSNLQNLKSCIANAWYSLDINALVKHETRYQTESRQLSVQKVVQ